MTQVELDEKGQRFLIELFTQTKGNPSAKASMFDIGAKLDMDKHLSSRTAEILISWELAEVKTLSGAIGITEAGIEEVRKSGAAGSEFSGGLRLNDTPVIDDSGCKMIEQFLIPLKNQIGSMGFNFEDMTEIVADLKSIDAQLTSSRVKTAIIRESFRSVRNNLKKVKATEIVNQINRLLGE